MGLAVKQRVIISVLTIVQLQILKVKKGKHDKEGHLVDAYIVQLIPEREFEVVYGEHEYN